MCRSALICRNPQTNIPNGCQTNMDIEQARFNMIEQQIRTWQVLDQDILDLLFIVRREEFDASLGELFGARDYVCRFRVAA